MIISVENKVKNVLKRVQFVCFVLVTKADSMRKIIQHLDGRNWRPLDYFRMLESKRKLQGQNEPISQHSSVRFQYSFDDFHKKS